MRRAISVTIDEDNLLWLKGQAAATSRGSVSAVLDRLVAEARAEGGTRMQTMKSVVGTIDLAADDADFEDASAYVRDLFERSLRRPMLVKEDRPKPKRRTRRRG